MEGKSSCGGGGPTGALLINMAPWDIHAWLLCLGSRVVGGFSDPSSSSSFIVHCGLKVFIASLSCNIHWLLDLLSRSNVS